MVRMKLKLFRISKNLSHQEMADLIGVTRSTYAMVERGQRRGSAEMWIAFKNAFNVSDAEMWAFMQKGEE